MRSKFLIFIALLIAVGFAMFAFTRTVKFTETAVVSTFGSADQNSVIEKPGLVFRWPQPIQKVTVYDKRSRVFSTRSETQQTADNRQIVVEAFLAWRISDPLKFFKFFSGEGSEERRHYALAQRTLESQLRSAMSEVSAFRLNDLFAPTPGASKLPELEKRILARLTEPAESGSRIADWGVEPVLVGINRVVFPDDTTKSVFDRMKSTQERLASEARSRGEALAATIKASAQSAADRILAFASSRAQEIRVKGDEEAAGWFAKLNEEPALAVFIESINNLREFFGRNATLVVPTDMPGMTVFDPAVMSKLGENGLPPFAGAQDGATDAPPGNLAPSKAPVTSAGEPAGGPR